MQAKQPEIISYSALLSFHDSIDLFMGLVAEKKGIQNRRSLMINGEEIITAPITNEDALTDNKTRYAINFVLEFTLKVQNYK